MESPFKKIKSENVYSGRVINVDVDTLEYKGREIKWELVNSGNAVVVIPYLGDGRFVMIYQYRYTLGGYMWEFPAGRIEDEEDLVESAQRELEEECGYRAKNMQRVLSYFPSPGVFTEKMHLMFADGLYESNDAEPDHDEIIETRIVDFQKIGEMIKSGEIFDAKSILAYYHLKLNPDLMQ